MKTLQRRFAAGTLGLIVLVFLVNAFIVSNVSYDREQRILYADFRHQLANGIAPVDMPTENGIPIAIVRIPKLKVDDVVVEGTSGEVLRRGVGHLRSSSMPGQYGTSVLLARHTTFGGTFGELGSLEPGDEIEVVSAQGTSTYVVAEVGKFDGGDAAAFAPGGNAIRLVTSSSTFGTGDRLSVLALAKKGTVFPNGIRSVATPISLDELGANLNHQNAGGMLVWLQILLVVIVAGLWLINRWGFRFSWPFVAPVLVLVAWIACDQVIKLLPSTL